MNIFNPITWMLAINIVVLIKFDIAGFLILCGLEFLFITIFNR